MQRKFRKPCSKICEPGCQCQSGFVLNEDGLCIQPEDCPESTKRRKDKKESNDNDEDVSSLVADNLDVFLELTRHSSSEDNNKRSKRRRTKTANTLEQPEHHVEGVLLQSSESSRDNPTLKRDNHREHKRLSNTKRQKKSRKKSQQPELSEFQQLLQTRQVSRKESVDKDTETANSFRTSDDHHSNVDLVSDNVRNHQGQSRLLFQGRDMFDMLDRNE